MMANVESSDNVDVDGVVLHAFFELMGKWEVSAEQQYILLGEPNWKDFEKWQTGTVTGLPDDTRFRIGLFLGIHKFLRVLFSNPNNLYGWVSRANTDFDGKSPMEVMLQGQLEDIKLIRQYLASRAVGN